MLKRIVAAALSVAMLLTFIPNLMIASYASDNIEILHDGNIEDSVALPLDGSVELEASSGNGHYQWQIQVSDDIWADIYGDTGSTINVTYAMVANLLSNGETNIRCKSIENEEVAYSDSVTITVVEAANPTEGAAQGTEHKVLPAPTATINEEAKETVDVEALYSAVESAETALMEAQKQADSAEEVCTAAQADADAKKAVANDADQKAQAAEAALAEAKSALESKESPDSVETNTTEETAEDTTEGEVDEEPSEPVVEVDIAALEAAAAEARSTADTAAKEASDAQAVADAAKAEKDAADLALAEAQKAFDQACDAYAAATAPMVAALNLETADETQEQAKYRVVINYVFENNEIVAEPYVAELTAGSNFSATVNHPTVQGYLPYVGDETSTSIELNITNIDKDVTYTVTYKPTNVNYTVIHYQQNVDNDLYSEFERETLQGLTKSKVDVETKNYDGFYALLYEKPEIAADGSTVVEVYYDRYYYLMNFDLDGGYGTEPIYARYGAEISNITEPTKAGYTFKGWSGDGTHVVDLPETMPAKNVTYKAVWQEDATAKVTVVFWGENADDEEYSYIKSAQVDVKPGTEFTYSEDGSLICALEEHPNHNNCTVTCTQQEHEHTVEGNCYKLNCTETSHDHVAYGCEPLNCTHRHMFYCDIGFCDHKQHDDSCYTCGKTAGTHVHSVENGCYVLTCTTPTHTHNDECDYDCGKTVHSHSSSCYMSGAGLDSSLWTFVESDTVTVAADGSTVVNVYYDRVEYSVRFYENQSCSDSEEYTDLRITAKWGANILNKWPKYNGSSSWRVEGGKAWQNSIQIMPVGGAKFWGPVAGDGNYKAYYYVEALPGDVDTFEYNNVTYKLHHADTSISDAPVSDEERYAIEGFIYKEGTANGKRYDNAKFYYIRHRYAIEFFNPTALLKKTENVPYQSALSSYNWTPDASQAPVKYEPGSVEFEGWYLNPECTGEKFNFATHTMPAGTNDGDTTLTLYAKWVPVKHTVEFYLDSAALEAGTILGTVTVPHGSKAKAEDVAKPENGAYVFVGWFYVDAGVEKAFDFANMPITKDMKVYAKWSSNTLKEYFVYYKVRNKDGKATIIADPTSGSALAGHTKTFDAKGGAELYADYQEGYFPLVQSHSMTIDINDDTKNTYTFWYVEKEAVPYTVKYLNNETGKSVASDKVVDDNRKAVVTETFEPVQGMMPDAYQKRLVVSGAEGAKNEIIFYYVEDTEHAYYKITHYTQNTDGKTWTEYASSQAVGEIGQTYTADPLTIDGFTYDSTVEGTVVSGELTANGLELKLYYVRNEYPYEVRYLEQGTGKQLAEPKKDRGKYGQVISESVIDIPYYTAVGPTTQEWVIKIEKSENNEAALNIITFYYVEDEVIINYVAVGSGTVNPKSETVKVLSGTSQGSTATAAEGYRFVGWYSDAECTQQISTDEEYRPEKVAVSEDNPDEKVNVAATYYAKFELADVILTINKTFAYSKDADSKQTFIFNIVGTDNNVNMKVTVLGEGSVAVKLPVGKYTVTEDTTWSWRYTSDPTTHSVDLQSNVQIVFKNSRKNDYWLSGEAHTNNLFNAVSANS